MDHSFSSNFLKDKLKYLLVDKSDKVSRNTDCLLSPLPYENITLEENSGQTLFFCNVQFSQQKLLSIFLVFTQW